MAPFPPCTLLIPFLWLGIHLPEEEPEALKKPAFSYRRPRRGRAHLSSMPDCLGLGSLATPLLHDCSHQSGWLPVCCPSSLTHLSLSVYAVLAPGPQPGRPLKAIVSNAARNDAVLSQGSPLFLSGERPVEVISSGSLSLSCPEGHTWSHNPSLYSWFRPSCPFLGYETSTLFFSIPCPLGPPPQPLQTGLACLTSTTWPGLFSPDAGFHWPTLCPHHKWMLSISWGFFLLR